MRKWKDDGSGIIPIKTRQLCLLGAFAVIAMAVIPIVLTRIITITEMFNFGLAFFLIWGIKFNGFYKLARRYAEYKLRKSDNKWR